MLTRIFFIIAVGLAVMLNKDVLSTLDASLYEPVIAIIVTLMIYPWLMRQFD